MEDQFQAIPEVSSQLPAQQQSNVLADASVINKIQEKANQNNQLLEQVNSLTTTLAKGTLSSQEQARLTPQQLRAIQTNDMNSIAQQVGMVKWTMSERGRQLGSSLKFFAETQAQFREEQRMKREDSRRNILEAIEMVGTEAFAGMSDADKRRVEREAGFETGFLSRAQTGLQARERKLEEERQLQLEQARQQMELAKRAADLDERQFGFSQEMARKELALSQAKLAEDKRQANMINTRETANTTQEVKPLSEWEAKAVERSTLRDVLVGEGPQKIIKEGMEKNQSKKVIANRLVNDVRGTSGLNILTQKEIQEEVFRFVGLTPESEEWK